MENLPYVFGFVGFFASNVISIFLLVSVKVLKEYFFMSPDDKNAFKKENPQYMTFCSVFYPVFFSTCIVMFLGDYEQIRAMSLYANAKQAPIISTVFMIIAFFSASIMGIIAISIMFRYNMCPFKLKRPIFILKPVQEKLHIHEKSDLISQLLIKKDNENLVARFTLWASFLSLYYRYFKNPEISTLIVMIVTGSLFVFSFLNQNIIHYRVKHGLYGTCYLEAKEIISYILVRQNEQQNNGGGMPKLVFTPEEIDQCLQVNGGEEYAG